MASDRMIARTDIATLRLVALRLAGPSCADPVEAVSVMSAAQGQDLPGLLTSIALRTRSRSLSEVRNSFDGGEIVRSWPMRGTLHAVRADDLGWMLSLTADRMIAGAARRRESLGITDSIVERSWDVLQSHVAGGLTRAEVLAHWTSAGIEVDGGRGYHLLHHLAVRGRLHLGRLAGKEQLFVASTSLPAPRRAGEPVELVAAWLLDYVRGHGPATLADFVRWTGLTMTASRAAYATVADQIEVASDVDGREYLILPELMERSADPAIIKQAKQIHLLPGFDEFILGYADRSAQLEPHHERLICPGNNGVFKPTIVDAGRVIGTWRRDKKQVQPSGFAPLPSATLRRIDHASARPPIAD